MIQAYRVYIIRYTPFLTIKHSRLVLIKNEMKRRPKKGGKKREGQGMGECNTLLTLKNKLKIHWLR